MISLILAMVWTRRSQAVTLALLTMVAVASAVAAPAFLRSVDHAVAAGQIATALPAERSLSISGVQDDRAIARARADPGNAVQVADFTATGPALARQRGFEYVFAGEFRVVGLEREQTRSTRFVFRQHVCEHLIMVTGRCLAGRDEVVVGAGTAQRLGLRAGQKTTVTYAHSSGEATTAADKPAGEPATLTVAGTYRVAAPGEQYWGAHGYFAAGSGEPLFASLATMKAVDHGTAEYFMDGTAVPGTLETADAAALRADLEQVVEQSAQLGLSVTASTEVPALLDRITAGRRTARVIEPLLAVPLVLLACLSVFLAAGYATEGRRPELAVVALRGARLGGRWLLATGESLVALLAGALLGCLAGQVLVDLVALGLPGGSAAPGWDSLRWAPVAAGAALLAALLAQGRVLVAPVVELLRSAPRRSGDGRAIAAEVGVAVIAALVGAQLFVSGSGLTGVGLLAPALLIVAPALLLSRALLPLVTRVAARAMARGRLGAGLAGVQLTRRPGANRLFTLLVAAVAVAGYAACAIDVAAQGRAAEARLGTGADRVLSVGPVDRQRLLQSVRRLGPYAMAVSGILGPGDDPVLGLAVDTPRLAEVTGTTWPGQAPPADAVAARLRPAAPEPTVLAGPVLRLTVTAEAPGLTLKARLTGVTGLGGATVSFGELRTGRYEYRQRADECRDGCRLDTLEFSGGRGTVILPALGARWRAGRGGTVDGSIVTVDGSVVLEPVSTPPALPVARSGPVSDPEAVRLFDGRQVPAVEAVALPVVPRLGRGAYLVDFEYADRLSASGLAIDPQIWLSPGAPPDVLARVAAQGLSVTSDVSVTQARDRLDTQGPALALWFYGLAAGLSIALAGGALVLAAAIDRTRRAEDLSALRVQGLPRAAVRQATRWTYPALVVLAVLTGLGVALAAWALTGWALPLTGTDLPVPGWPRARVVAATGVVVLAVLAVVAVLAGRRTARRIR